MIPPHLFYQIYLSVLEQNDCTPPKCGWSLIQAEPVADIMEGGEGGMAHTQTFH